MFPAPTLGKIIEVRERVRGPGAPAPTRAPPPSPYPPGPTLAEWTRLQTPVVAALVLREQLRPAYRAEYGVTLRATDWAPRRDGGHAPAYGGGRSGRCWCEAADAPSTVRLVLPDEEAGDFTFVTYQERMPQSREGGAATGRAA